MILMIKCLLFFCEENKNAEEVLGSIFFYYFCRKVYRIMNYMSNTHIVCIDEGSFSSIDLLLSENDVFVQLLF